MGGSGVLGSIFAFFTGKDLTNIAIDNWIGQLNFFKDVDGFSALYSWLPSDIGSACRAIIVVSLFLFVLGLIHKVVLQ